MPSRPTKGEVEAAIRNAVIKFEQEFMRRGLSEVKAYIMRAIILVRLKGVLTLAERQLAKSPEGIEMVRRMRQTLISQGRDSLTKEITQLIEVKILGIFTDIDTQAGERVIVFTVDRDLEATFLQTG